MFISNISHSISNSKVNIRIRHPYIYVHKITFQVKISKICLKEVYICTKFQRYMTKKWNLAIPKIDAYTSFSSGLKDQRKTRCKISFITNIVKMGLLYSIMTYHSRKNTGRFNNTNDDSVPLSVPVTVTENQHAQ